MLLYLKKERAKMLLPVINTKPNTGCVSKSRFAAASLHMKLYPLPATVPKAACGTAGLALASNPCGARLHSNSGGMEQVQQMQIFLVPVLSLTSGKV